MAGKRRDLSHLEHALDGARAVGTAPEPASARTGSHEGTPRGRHRAHATPAVMSIPRPCSSSVRFAEFPARSV